MSALLKLSSSVCRNWSLSRTYSNHLLKENSTVKKFLNTTRFSTKHSWEVDTNVTKDVVLYIHNNPRFHRYLNLFAITQFGFWLYLAEFSLSTLRDIPVQKTESDTNLPWYRSINLGENKYRRGITTMCVAVGEHSKFNYYIEDLKLQHHIHISFSSIQEYLFWVVAGCSHLRL